MNGKAPLSTWFWISHEGLLVTPNYLVSIFPLRIERRP